MTVTVTTPGGSTSSGAFTFIGGVTWDAPPCISSIVPVITSSRSLNVNLVSDLSGVPNLTAQNKAQGFTGQGAVVSPTFLQNAGTFYWEINWESVDPLLVGGIGFCVSPPSVIPGRGGFNALQDFYNQLAANGTRGVILRPDGTIWVNGTRQDVPNPPPTTFFPTQSDGDTVGIAATIASDGSGGANFFGVGGKILPSETSTFAFDPGTFNAIIPCVVFGNAGTNNIAVANFGANGFDSFLGPQNIANFLDLIPGAQFLGWPNTL